MLDKVTSQYAQPAYIKGTQDTAGIPEGHHVVAAGLSTFNNPSKDPKSPSSTVYHHIFTNNFWPMDTASSYGTKDHDIKFGSFAQKDNRKYSGIGRDISSLNTLPLSDDGLDHNSYFGMHYSVDFVVDPGYAGDLLYYFYGDDDLFVYLTRLPDEKPSYEAVDPAGQPEMASMLETSALSTQAENSLHTLDPGQSKLIADVGGVHSSVGMYVNLRDYISPIPYKDARGNDNSAQRYRLDFFYTERGASGSTCYMRFTVPFESLEANQMKYNGQVNVEKEVKNKSLETLTDPASAETKEQFVFQIDLKSPYGEDYHPLGVDDFTSCLSLTNRYPYKKYQRQKDGSSKLIESSTTWQDSDGTTHQGTGQYIMDGTQFVLEDQQYLVIEGLPGETVKISGGEQSEEDEEKEPVAPSPKQPGSATSISTHDGPPEMTRTYYRVHELGSLSAEKAADVQP